jgi:glucokinase
VSRIVRRLVEQGVVREVEGDSEQTGGRPRTTISFNRQAGAVIGIDLGGTKCRGFLADLGGDVLQEETRPTTAGGAPYPTLVAVIDTLMAHAGDLHRPVEAIAVGIPAIVDPVDGLALAGPNVHWQGFPIVRELEARTSTPLVVDNDVNLAAVGHAWRGDARRHANFVTLAIGTGIGAAIVADRRLIRGRTNAAGEVGYLVMSRDQLREPPGRGPGAFEQIASGPGIVALTRERMQASPASKRGMPEDVPLTAEGVFAAAAAGNEIAAAVIDEVLDYVSVAIIALIAVVDPEVVILEGSVGRAFAPYVSRLVERVRPHVPTEPRIVISTLGSDATAIGAVAAALQLTRHRRSPLALRDSLVPPSAIAATAMLDLPEFAPEPG